MTLMLWGTPAMKRRELCSAIAASLLVGCVPSRQGVPSVESGFTSAGNGLAQLILSPLMIAAGLLEGLISIPYFILAGLHDLNRGLVSASANVTLDDTYRQAYGRNLEGVAPSGETGEVFTEMRSATAFFRRMMRGYGDVDANHYVLTAIRTADSRGYTLYAVCRRPAGVIHVIDKLDPTQIRSYGTQDLEFYRPYAMDVAGRPIDTVIDWAGVPRVDIHTQKTQAVLMTLAANSAVSEKSTADYWAVERQWIAGQFYEISARRDLQLRERMGLAMSPYYPSTAEFA